MSFAPSQLLTTWESHRHGTVGEHALALLRLALPSRSDDHLADVPIGRRDQAIARLRGEVFGPVMRCRALCPHCETELEFNLSVDQVLSLKASEGAATQLLVGRYALQLRTPTTRDFSRLEAGHGQLATLLQSCVKEATHNGDPIDPAELPPEIVAAISDTLQELDPAGNLSVPIPCPDCGATEEHPFDPIEYVWRELEIWAKRLVREVHELASNYGWSEQEILGLSEPRRQAYLEVVRA